MCTLIVLFACDANCSLCIHFNYFNFYRTDKLRIRMRKKYQWASRFHESFNLMKNSFFACRSYLTFKWYAAKTVEVKNLALTGGCPAANSFMGFKCVQTVCAAILFYSVYPFIDTRKIRKRMQTQLTQSFRRVMYVC